MPGCLLGGMTKCLTEHTAPALKRPDNGGGGGMEPV